MKNKIYLLLIISALFINCSKDSDTISNEDLETYKLLKRVTYTDFYWGQMNLDFAYSNGLLIKENDGGELVYYEYNSENKISLEKECSDQNLDDIIIDNYNCSAFYPPRTYTYTNGRRNGLNYDERGNVISDISTAPASESIYYTYDEKDIITKMEVTDGNSGYTLTYEWDGKKNPFYSFWKKYGYYDWGGRGFDPYEFVSCINKQNATKVFKDNILITEANYTYDADGYPISCGFIEHLSNGGTREGTVTYIYN